MLLVVRFGLAVYIFYMPNLHVLLSLLQILASIIITTTLSRFTALDASGTKYIGDM